MADPDRGGTRALAASSRGADPFEGPATAQGWRWADFVITILGVLVVGQVVAGLAVAAGGVEPSGDLSAGWIAIAGTASFVATIGLAALLVGRRGRGSVVDAFGLGLRSSHLRYLAGGIGISVIAGITLQALGAIVDHHDSPQAVAEAVEAASGPGLVLLIVAVVVFAPIGEEVLYRGLLFGAARRTQSLVSAALVSGAIFSSIHILGLDLSSGAAIALGALGLVWFLIIGALAAALVDRHKSLMPAIWLHMGFNLAGAVVLILS